MFFVILRGFCNQSKHGAGAILSFDRLFQTNRFVTRWSSGYESYSFVNRTELTVPTNEFAYLVIDVSCFDPSSCDCDSITV